MAGGGWPWVALALAAYVLRRARRPVDDTVSLRVRPGERYLVSLTGPDAADPG
jgi:MYXO-CTERM domain-containing protein